MTCKICREEFNGYYFDWVWDGKEYIPVCHADILQSEKNRILYCGVHREYFFPTTKCPKCCEEVETMYDLMRKINGKWERFDYCADEHEALILLSLAEAQYPFDRFRLVRIEEEVNENEADRL